MKNPMKRKEKIYFAFNRRLHLVASQLHRPVFAARLAQLAALAEEETRMIGLLVSLVSRDLDLGRKSGLPQPFVRQSVRGGGIG